MHDCENCGMACACDGEDAYGAPQPTNCRHRCDEDDSEPRRYCGQENCTGDGWHTVMVKGGMQPLPCPLAVESLAPADQGLPREGKARGAEPRS